MVLCSKYMTSMEKRDSGNNWQNMYSVDPLYAADFRGHVTEGLMLQATHVICEIEI
jgi:hypothetical protein